MRDPKSGSLSLPPRIERTWLSTFSLQCGNSVPVVHLLPGTFQGLSVGLFEALDDDVVGRVQEFDHLVFRNVSVAGEGVPVAFVEVAGRSDGRVLPAQEAGKLLVRLERDLHRRLFDVKDGEDLAADLEDPVFLAEGKSRRGARLPPAMVFQVLREGPFFQERPPFFGRTFSERSLITDLVSPTGRFRIRGAGKR